MSDTTEYMEGLAAQYEVAIERRENQWNNGIHIDQNDNKYKLSEMTDEHLKNAINYFKKSHDVSSLKEELKKRKLQDKNVHENVQ